ncbi:hypothetical protein AOC05_05095 [Arthrobacter alpinus]|uniref:HTH cro/C1-type domain-containing protein n=1 Tax=Arthrobacter alpinus TaxID=656366 RepID=A0A0M3UFY9_9MICC|nr:hypothetical protein AOC05_05095 [Arthrobacter alpinus]
MRKLSQRDFAAKLTEKGMPVDASAVSRIENGTRSVRLVEALTIAEVLDTELDWLVSGSKSISQQFTSMRKRATNALLELGEPVTAAAYHLWETRWFLSKNPELLGELSDEELGAPSDADSYLSWVASRMERWVVTDEEIILADSQEELDQIIDVLHRLVRMHVQLRTAPEADFEDSNVSAEDPQDYGLAAFKGEDNIAFDDEPHET